MKFFSYEDYIQTLLETITIPWEKRMHTEGMTYSEMLSHVKMEKKSLLQEYKDYVISEIERLCCEKVQPYGYTFVDNIENHKRKILDVLSSINPELFQRYHFTVEFEVDVDMNMNTTKIDFNVMHFELKDLTKEEWYYYEEYAIPRV